MLVLEMQEAIGQMCMPTVRPGAMVYMTDSTPVTIPLRDALICESCSSIVDARSIRGEVCSCGAQGSLMSLARVLAPNPELGRISYILID